MSRIQAPKGTFDILPETIATQSWQSAQLWQKVEELLQKLCSRWGFFPIRLPIFETTDLFYKNSGSETTLVQKEMYTFQDKGQRSLTLRPEGTPGALRALLENGAFSKSQIQKIYYMGPMFRYERPQKGRYRQFHQFGVELLGPRSPWFDADLIALAVEIAHALGLQPKLLLNSLGSDRCRALYSEKLIAYFKKVEAHLSEESQQRLLTNPLRILDSKDPLDQPFKQEAPKLSDSISEESKRFFDQVLELLEKIGVEYTLDPYLVRGLDYYCDTVFELQEEVGGISLGGGGRYGRMLSEMGGPPFEGIGFAMGMERLLQATLKSGRVCAPKETLDLFFIALGELPAKKIFSLASTLRKKGFAIDSWHSFEPKKLKAGLVHADHLRARFVAILGEEEAFAQKIQLRNMQTRTQLLVEDSELSTYLGIV